MKKKRILILANNVNGLYHFRYELMKKILEKSNEIYFSVPESKKHNKVKLLIQAGAKHIQTYINRRGKNPYEDIKLIFEYKKIIKKINPDIVLTYTIKPNIYGTYVANKYDIPSIMNITGIGTSLTNSKLKSFIKYLYKYTCNKANKIFFQNQSNLFLFLSNEMVEKEKTILVPGSGVNIEKFKPLDMTNNDQIIRFLFIGRIMKEKGIEEYLKVSKKLTNKYDNVEFQILGSYEEKKYKDIIESNSNVKYLGYSKDVKNEIKEVNCVINPSYHEGMSNVLLESAAMAKPLIASNIPGCKEIIEDGVNGYLFEVKSAQSLTEKINKFININAEQKEKMGINSRKKIKKEFDRKIVINAYLKEINNILYKKR